MVLSKILIINYKRIHKGRNCTQATKRKVESLTNWFFFINGNKHELLLKSKGYNSKENISISVKSLAFIAVNFVPGQRLSDFPGGVLPLMDYTGRPRPKGPGYLFQSSGICISKGRDFTRRRI